MDADDKSIGRAGWLFACLLRSMETRVLERTEEPHAHKTPLVATSETIAILSQNNTSRLTELILGPLPSRVFLIGL